MIEAKIRTFQRLNDVNSPWDNPGYGFSKEYDISSLLLYEGDIETDDRVEFKEVFNFVSGGAEILIDNDHGEIENLLNGEEVKEKGKWLLILHIKSDGKDFYYGSIIPERLEYNERADTFKIETNDPVQQVIKSDGEIYIPQITGDVTVEAVLREMFKGITPNPQQPSVVPVNVEIGNITHYLGYSDYNDIRTNKMTRKDFLIEMQKSFGTYIYFDRAGNLNLVNRSAYINEINLDSEILGAYNGSEVEIGNTVVRHEAHNSILLNRSWDASSSGWSLIYEEGGALRIIDGINADLSNIPADKEYLDLRQKLTGDGSGNFDYSFDYKLFPQYTTDEIWELYKTVLSPVEIYRRNVDGTDYNLFDKATIDGKSMTIFNMRRRLLGKTSELELLKIK